MDKKKLIEKGDNNYNLFIEKIGLDRNKIKTPHTNNLFDMGQFEISDKEFIKKAIYELYHSLNLN